MAKGKSGPSKPSPMPMMSGGKSGGAKPAGGKPKMSGGGKGGKAGCK